MTSPNLKNRKKGIIGTLLFHALITITFIFTGLKYQDPPPPEEGISINFGISNEELKNSTPQNTKKIIKIEEELTDEKIKNTEEVTTQSLENTVEIKEKKIKEENIEIIKEKKPKINKKAIYKGKKKKQKKSQDKKEMEVNQDLFSKNKNLNLFEGSGTGEDDAAYQLGGRKAVEKVKPEGNQIEGKVVVMIIVDRQGNVIYAKAGGKGSTTLNKKLLERAKKAALQTKFDIDESAPQNQQGRIIYDFRLN